jgi:hypothetical protein
VLVVRLFQVGDLLVRPCTAPHAHLRGSLLDDGLAMARIRAAHGFLYLFLM